MTPDEPFRTTEARCSEPKECSGSSEPARCANLPISLQPEQSGPGRGYDPPVWELKQPLRNSVSYYGLVAHGLKKAQEKPFSKSLSGSIPAVVARALRTRDTMPVFNVHGLAMSKSSLRAVVVIGLVVLLTRFDTVAAGEYPACASSGRRTLNDADWKHWQGCQFDSNGIQRVVFAAKTNRPDKPPVLLLHELVGLTPKTLQYADSLSGEFSVYLPLLFGAPAEDGFLAGILKGTVAYALNGEWHPEEKRPIYVWARHLSDWIVERHPGRNMGVIGMCLTGTMPLALLSNEHVRAVVVSQPTLPLLAFSGEAKASLALSALELGTAIERTGRGQAEILGFRFQGDSLAKRDKLATLQEAFGPAYIDREICSTDYAKYHIKPNAHSVLIYDWQSRPPDHPTNVRRKEVEQFLASRLLGVGRSPLAVSCKGFR